MICKKDDERVMVTVSRRPKENNATLDVEIDIHDDGKNFF